MEERKTFLCGVLTRNVTNLNDLHVKFMFRSFHMEKMCQFTSVE